MKLAFLAEVYFTNALPGQAADVPLSVPLEVCAARLALRHIRQRNGTIAPRLAQLSEPPNINLTVIDTKGTVLGATKAFNSIIGKRDTSSGAGMLAAMPSAEVHAVLGPPNDDEATVVGHMSTAMGTPMLAYRSKASKLSYRDEFDGYPYLSRVDNDRLKVAGRATHRAQLSAHSVHGAPLERSHRLCAAQVAEGLRLALTALNVTSYGVLYDSSEGYAHSLVELLASLGAVYGDAPAMTLRADMREQGGYLDVPSALDKLVAGGTTVIVAIIEQVTRQGHARCSDPSAASARCTPLTRLRRVCCRWMGGSSATPSSRRRTSRTRGYRGWGWAAGCSSKKARSASSRGTPRTPRTRSPGHGASAGDPSCVVGCSRGAALALRTRARWRRPWWT